MTDSPPFTTARVTDTMPNELKSQGPSIAEAIQTSPELPRFDNHRVVIMESSIHGLGLFSTQMFFKGQTIGYYQGREVEEGEEGDHVLWIFDEEEEREYGIEGHNETRFVNHSREPNANFNGEELVALRGIELGEEITHDYGEAWSDLG